MYVGFWQQQFVGVAATVFADPRCLLMLMARYTTGTKHNGFGRTGMAELLVMINNITNKYV